jgi:PadR family transcriptional regulator AphA
MTPSEWAVLALLAEGPTHGFAIARAMADNGEIGKVWSLRRPRVYYAINTLIRVGYARATGTTASRSGPDRTVLRITPSGRRALTEWLATPVEHVRDARSQLLLKLLFLGRRNDDARPLLHVQRAHFEHIATRLKTATEQAGGFDQTLLQWRLETVTAAVRFIDSIIEVPGRGRSVTSRGTGGRSGTA